MKRTLSLIFLIALISLSKAQVSINYLGDLNTKRIYCYPVDTTTNTGTQTAAIVSLHSSKHAYTIGVSGNVSTAIGGTSFMKHAIGLKGQAARADGMNFGVYGTVIPPTGSPGYLNYGAGVYGTSKSTIKILSNTYAGYFDGIVGISGNLTVNGNIRGTVLSSAASSSFANKSVDALDQSSNVTEQLYGLRMASFYLHPTETKEVILADNMEGTEAEQLQVTSAFIDEGAEQITSRKHFGLDADALKEVFPDLVYDNEDGTKSINYVEMVPILVQAINELNAKIETLEGGNGDVMMAKKVATGIDETAESIQILSLGQNKPNPFSTTTSVEVSVPEDVQSAFIYVYDLTGKKVQQTDITARGRQTVQLNAASLEEGMYLYSLIADGKVVQTRRMIVEK